jgi:hypothetical protein
MSQKRAFFKSKDDQMDGNCIYWDVENAYKVLVGKHGMRRPLQRNKCRWENVQVCIAVQISRRLL